MEKGPSCPEFNYQDSCEISSSDWQERTTDQTTSIATVKSQVVKSETKTFHCFLKLPPELQIQVWPYVAKYWLRATLGNKGLYTRFPRTDRSKMYLPFDIGIKPSRQSPLFSISQLSRDVMFDVLRVYDKDVQFWKYAKDWWFEPIFNRRRMVYMADYESAKYRGGFQMVDFRPTRRSKRIRTLGRVDYGVEGMIERLEQRCDDL